MFLGMRFNDFSKMKFDTFRIRAARTSLEITEFLRKVILFHKYLAFSHLHSII